MVDDNVTSIPPELLGILRTVKDPEIDVVDIVELGILRSAEITGRDVTVKITPTYSGCPAMHTIEAEVKAALSAAGYLVTIVVTHTPPWSTDWITSEAREKMRAYGIAPPGMRSAAVPLVEIGGRAAEGVACPRCTSCDVSLRSQFGSTACKALYWCNSCSEPFEYFKPF